MKKGQGTGASAATFVALLAALILLYVLFLPPSEREALLGENYTGYGGDDGGNDTAERTILLENPGKIEGSGEEEIIHNIASLSLLAVTETNLIKKVNNIYVKNGWFDKQDARVSFTFEDLPNTDNTMMGFTIGEKAIGRLSVYLNGEKVYDDETTSPAPVLLDKKNLAETNELVLSVSTVGWKFWKTNEYIIKDLSITADVQDISRQTSRNTFIVTSTEKDNLEKATLKFIPECEAGDVGKLNIYINNHNLYSSVPDCGLLIPLEFSPGFLSTGENELVFRTTRGNYVIDRIQVKTELKDISFPVYYFSLTSDEYNDVANNEFDINLSMDFVDDIEYKQATIVVNGYETHVDQRDRKYWKLIDEFIKKDNNAIEIIPKKNSKLEIIELRVRLQEH
ncbi:hypothetical protein JW968_03270 [Candidatus Woesearchaeota archaeon]|nr:hypothetical protein [Candidatus Woesearchaeota archaeon]